MGLLTVGYLANVMTVYTIIMELEIFLTPCNYILTSSTVLDPQLVAWTSFLTTAFSCKFSKSSRFGVLFTIISIKSDKMSIGFDKNQHRTRSEHILHKPNAAFRLACRLPHCHYDDICWTAQVPLAAEGWLSGKQRIVNILITLPPWPLPTGTAVIAYSWLQFNSEAMLLADKAKAAWLLRAVTFKQ